MGLLIGEIKMKLEKSESMRALLTSQIMLQRYKGNATMMIREEQVFKDSSGKEKPSFVVVASDKQEYLMVLNETNKNILIDYATQHFEGEPNTSMFMKYSLNLETYETGNQGKFAVGVRIIDILSPTKK